MPDYWHKHYTESTSVNLDSPLKQVGKTVNGIEVEESQIDLIVIQIVNVLKLSVTDTLFDLCCGNGLLTVRLAEHAGNVTGIDYTESLLKVARNHYSRPNLRYSLSDVLGLSSAELKQANRFSMYEALQHLNVDQFGKLMSNLSLKPAGTLFFVGGIPDRQRLRNFYDTEEKYDFYKETERIGRPHLGRWWLEEEILMQAERAGYSMKSLSQPPGLYTAQYRFDALLEKVD